MQRRTLLAAIALAALLVPGAALAQQKPPIKLGYLGPLTGFLTAYGKTQEMVVKMAVEDVNAKGGINGSQLTLMSEDTSIDPGQAVLMFRKLAGEGAFAVIGPQTGTQWETVSPLANQLEVPALTATALKSGVTKRPWTIRVHPADDTMIPEGFAAFRKLYPKVKKVLIMADIREASGKAGAELFEKYAKEAGMEVMELVEFSTRTTDMSPAAIQVKGKNPDAVLVAALGPSAVMIAKEFKVQNITAPVLTSAIIWPGTFVNVIGDEGKTWHTMGFGTMNKVTGDNALNSQLWNRLQERADPAIMSKPANLANWPVSYDAVMLLADIMRRNGIDGATDVKKAREAIKNEFVKLQGFSGVHVYKMRDTGDFHVPAAILTPDVEKKVWKFAGE